MVRGEEPVPQAPHREIPAPLPVITSVNVERAVFVVWLRKTQTIMESGMPVNVQTLQIVMMGYTAMEPRPVSMTSVILEVIPAHLFFATRKMTHAFWNVQLMQIVMMGYIAMEPRPV